MLSPLNAIGEWLRDTPFIWRTHCGIAARREAALETYLLRARLGDWHQEVFISLLSVAELKEALQYPNDEIIAAYVNATTACPTRAEALHGVARFCRNKGIYEHGYEFATKGLAIAYPNEALFIRDWIYEYGLLDELAVNAYWTGRYAECVDACERLLREGKLPTEMRDRVLKNKDFASGKLQEAAASSSPEVDVFAQLLRAARRKEELAYPDEEVISAYKEATAACPTRAEAHHGAARFCRNKGLYERGYEFAAKGLAVAYPNDALFVETWIYEYGLLDELAVNAYWTERYQDCLDACQRLLRGGKMPPDMRDRVKKNAEFAAEKVRPVPIVKPMSTWTPETPSAGTELMVAGLRERLGAELDRINLHVNHPGQDKTDKRPRVVWMHHDVNQRWVQWCDDKELVDIGQLLRFHILLAERTIPHHVRAAAAPTLRRTPPRARHEPRNAPLGERADLALRLYEHAFRGLSILLDAWERISPANAELHIWSSMKLYMENDSPYQHLFARAQSMSGVIYHGLAPNPELRAALRTMHFLVYPCTFAETACLAAIEAMAAGCRLIIPSLGALPETTAGYARIYPSNPNAEEHVATFSENLAS